MNYFSSRPGLARPCFLLGSLLILFAPALPRARACACGCGVYEVGTDSMFPHDTGQMFFLENDFQDQNRNWHGAATAPAANNPDQDIRTDFVTAGLQGMFNRSWGLQLELPYIQRHFVTTGGATGDNLVTLNWSGLGDIRLQGFYTGLSDDLSTGFTFGVKLPSGSSTHEDAFGDIDRDTEIGSGSTDLLLGAFHRGNLTWAPHWVWFAQANLGLPVAIRDHYRPGAEGDAAIGMYFQARPHGSNGLTPVLQLKLTDRASDRGANAASPAASGFRRLLAAPGLEFTAGRFTGNAEVALPIYQHFVGNQLAASVLTKLGASYRF